VGLIPPKAPQEFHHKLKEMGIQKKRPGEVGKGKSGSESKRACALQEYVCAWRKTGASETKLESKQGMFGKRVIEKEKEPKSGFRRWILEEIGKGSCGQ